MAPSGERRTYEIVQLPAVGGGGGSRIPPWCMPEDGVITFFEVRWGSYLNQLLFHYTASSGDGIVSLGGLQPAPSHARLYLAAGELVQAFELTYGQYVNSVAIVTTHATHGPFGARGPSSSTPTLPTNSAFVGLHGRAGYWVDALGIAFGTLSGPPPVG